MVAILINEFIKVSVKSAGAELISIKDTFSNKEFLWQGDPTFWARRSPILFPIVGKVKDNKYKVGTHSFTMPQHGFARDMIFDIVDQNTSLSFVLNSNDETFRIYPFHFSLTVKYTLEKNKIIVNYLVQNTDTKKIYFSIGAHPAFYCPFIDGEKVSDYYIEFNETEKASRVVLEDGLTTNKLEDFLNGVKTFDLSETIFKQDAIIFKNLRSDKVALKSKKSSYKVLMDFTGFPYFALWSKSPMAPFVCLEPWYGIADHNNFEGDISQKEGILSLEVGKSFTCSYSLEFFPPKN